MAGGLAFLALTTLLGEGGGRLAATEGLLGECRGSLHTLEGKAGELEEMSGMVDKMRVCERKAEEQERRLAEVQGKVEEARRAFGARLAQQVAREAVVGSPGDEEELWAAIREREARVEALARRLEDREERLEEVEGRLEEARGVIARLRGEQGEAS